MSQVLEEEKKIKEEVGTLINEERMINFSDAVFAFAATLLVLKIDLPVLSGRALNLEVASAIASLWPQYLANIISFLIIGYYWLCHHGIFGMLAKFNSTIVWMNLVFLIFLSFIPFPVDLYGEYMHEPMIVVFYSGALALVGYMLVIMWIYVSHNFKLIHKSVGHKQVQYYTARLLVAPLIFTLAIPLVYIHPVLAQLSWILVILGVIVINKIFKQKKVTKFDKLTI